MVKLKLPDVEYMVLVDLADRANLPIEQYLKDLIHKAAWEYCKSQYQQALIASGVESLKSFVDRNEVLRQYENKEEKCL